MLAYLSDEAKRAPVVEELLRNAATNRLVVVTSTVSIAEVAYGAEEKLQRVLDAEVEARIDALWQPGSPVRLVEASRRVMVEARALMRKNLAAGHRALTPMDVVHLATAAIERVDQLATYEEKARPRWAELTGLNVVEPYVEQQSLDFHEPKDTPTDR